MKKLLLGTAVVATFLGAGVSTSAHAVLTSHAILAFNPGVTTVTSYSGSLISSVGSGSYFGMDVNGDGTIKANERNAISQHAGLHLGTIQAASGSHVGAPNGSESPGIDNPWSFFGYTGMHYTVIPPTILSAAGNTATIDFSGWRMDWNNYAINIGNYAWAGNANGVATVTCAVDCAADDTYALDYSAKWVLANLSSVDYNLHLEGTISPSLVPVPAAVWLFGSGLLSLIGFTRRKKMN